METPILLPSNDMRVCTNCGASMHVDKEACPWCGTENPQAVGRQSHQSDNWSLINWNLDQIVLVDEDTTLTLPEPLVKKQSISRQSTAKPQAAFWLRPFSAVLLLTLLMIIGLVSLGIYQGLNDRQVQRKVAAIEAFDEGRALMEEGEYELAVAYFREAVRLEPNFEAAQKFLEIAELDAQIVRSTEAEAVVEAEPEPESMTTKGTPEPVDHQEEKYSSVPTPMLDPVKLFANGMSALEKGEWDLAAATFDLLTSQTPTYKPVEVSNGLFKAQMELGRLALQEDDVEEALRHFDQALAARPTDADALELRRLSSTYYSALRAYEKKDWLTASKHLRSVYLIDRGFLDTLELLAQSHYELGQQYENREVWCQAAEQFRSSLAVLADNEVAELAEENENRCSIRATSPPPPRVTSTFLPNSTAKASAIVVATTPTPRPTQENVTRTPWSTLTATVIFTIEVQSTATPSPTSYVIPDVNATTTAYVAYLTSTPYVTPHIHATETAYVYNLTATAYVISTPISNPSPIETATSYIAPTQTAFIIPTATPVIEPEPTATPVIEPTATVLIVPTPTATVESIQEIPTNTPVSSSFAYVLASQSVNLDAGCGGHYIRGLVTAPDGAPLAGVTIQAIDQYGNWKTAVTKDNPLGEYDIPIPSDVTSYEVVVVAGPQQLSPKITIQHSQELSQSPTACHILNWRQTP